MSREAFHLRQEILEGTLPPPPPLPEEVILEGTLPPPSDYSLEGTLLPPPPISGARRIEHPRVESLQPPTSDLPLFDDERPLFTPEAEKPTPFQEIKAATEKFVRSPEFLLLEELPVQKKLLRIVESLHEEGKKTGYTGEAYRTARKQVAEVLRSASLEKVPRAERTQQTEKILEWIDLIEDAFLCRQLSMEIALRTADQSPEEMKWMLKEGLATRPTRYRTDEIDLLPE